MSEQSPWGWWNPDPVRRRSNAMSSIAWIFGVSGFLAGVGAV
ncbi:MAG: hypothetical protein ABI720_09515 [Actinomycetes bacterium]